MLIDLNIVLDVLQRREPFYTASAQLLALAEIGQIEGLIAAHSVTTLFYLVSKTQSAAAARATLTSLMQFLKIATVSHDTIEQALNLAYKDFEDAVQMVAALQSKADFLITRNLKDYQPPLIPAMQPVDFLATLSDGKGR
ncbi:MAG: PIN domain-containing protein [Anaerolineales bacterium]